MTVGLKTPANRAGARSEPPSVDIGHFPKSDIEQAIHDRFARIARLFPDRIAVSVNGATCSYLELRRAARGVAEALVRHGGDRSRPVALLMEPGARLFASMLGVLEAGRFYVPLDPSLGVNHLLAVLAEASADVLLTDSVSAGLLEGLDRGGARVLRAEEIPPREPAGAPPAAVSPDDAAYVLFTSGSSGSPKGVLQSHRNVLHNVFKLTRGLRLTSQDRLTLLSACSFGASVSDIYGALLNGAALCPWPLARDGLFGLKSFIQREGITVYHSVPGVFRRFAETLDGREDLSSLRILKLGGESVLASDLELYRRSFPKTCLFHVGLGATEMNVIRQWFADHDTPCPWPVAPVGYAVDDTEVLLLDERGLPASGDSGEIAIVSPTLPLGYWKRPDATAEAFRPVPGRDGWRIYRTGDWGRILPDGCLLYLGRRDSRVKIRGHRVELLEVEAALTRLPGITEAAVVARDGPGGARLIAYFTAGCGRPISVAQLRDGLRSRLPEAMIPSLFVSLDALPRTAGGKVDREALPAPGSSRPLVETPFIEPRSEAALEVSRLFADLLELEQVGAEDDFFDLGGDSLLAVEAILLLEKKFARRISPTDFLESSTPAAIAARLSSPPAPRESRVVSLKSSQGGPTIFLVPGGAGSEEELLVNARLARRLGGDVTVLALPAGDPPHAAAESLAAERVRLIRSIQPDGPYWLAGECVGGILAFAIARRLAEEHQRLALLVLLDTPYPTFGRRMLHRLRFLREPWGDHLGRRMQHHRRALAERKSDRFAYLLARARAAAKAFASAAWGKRRRLVRRRASYVGTLLAWRPGRIDGTISFIESAEGKRQGNSTRWSRLATAARVLHVPGDHHTYIREHAGRVAAPLRRWLDEAAAAEAGAAAGTAETSSIEAASPQADRSLRS